MSRIKQPSAETRDAARERSLFSLQSTAYERPEQYNWRTIHNIGFDAGARWAIMAGSELSPYVSRFIEMLILVGIADESESQEP